MRDRRRQGSTDAEEITRRRSQQIRRTRDHARQRRLQTDKIINNSRLLYAYRIVEAAIIGILGESRGEDISRTTSFTILEHRLMSRLH
jgi:adenylate kinase